MSARIWLKWIAVASITWPAFCFATSLTPGTTGTSPDGAGNYDLSKLITVGTPSAGSPWSESGQNRSGGTTTTFAAAGLSHIINGGPVGENATNANFFIRVFDYSFTLPTGWETSSIRIEGKFIGDDGVAIYVNGSTAPALSYGRGSANTFQSPEPWNRPQVWRLTNGYGLVPGANTLKFVIPDTTGTGGFTNVFTSVTGLAGDIAPNEPCIEYVLQTQPGLINTTVPVDMTILGDSCTGESGCTISLGKKQDANGPIDSRSPSVQFFYSSTTGEWSRLGTLNVYDQKQGKDKNDLAENILEFHPCYFLDGEYTIDNEEDRTDTDKVHKTDTEAQVGLLNWTGDPNTICVLFIVSDKTCEIVP